MRADFVSIFRNRLSLLELVLSALKAIAAAKKKPRTARLFFDITCRCGTCRASVHALQYRQNVRLMVKLPNTGGSFWPSNSRLR